jgi:hypothetical protein
MLKLLFIKMAANQDLETTTQVADASTLDDLRLSPGTVFLSHGELPSVRSSRQDGADCIVS